jgi:hypothetical protein
MAPLSKELSGLVLPHDHFGSHLNDQGVTIDDDLERENFKFAGQSLAEIWSEVAIDGYPTVAKFIDPSESEMEAGAIQSKDADWFSRHVRTSQYFTQVVKCKELDCCSVPRSSYFHVVPLRFLPPPIPLQQTIAEGLQSPDRSSPGEHTKFPPLFVAPSINWADVLPKSTRSFKQLPYDLYCPSVQCVLLERICKEYGLYFASKVLLKQHAIIHKKAKEPPAALRRVRPVRVAARRQREMMAIIVNQMGGPEQADWMDEDELDLDGVVIPTANPTAMPIYSMDAHLATPWNELVQE